MRKIIYSVLHGTAAVFCIFLAAAAVCGCSGMNGAAGNMTGKEEKRLNEEMAEKMERRLPEEVKREQIGKDTAITAMDRFLAKFYVMSDDGTGAIVGEQFWPRAEIMEIAVDAWEKTSSPQYRDLMEQMYLGFVKDFGEDWSDNEYNDDIIWMTIACEQGRVRRKKMKFIRNRQSDISIWFTTGHGVRIWAAACSGGRIIKPKTHVSTARPQ